MAIKIPRVQTDDRLLNQVQQNIAGVLEPIFNALSGSFTGTLTGLTKTVQGSVKWQRDTNTGIVMLALPNLSGTSNTTTMYMTGLPALLWPVSTQYMVAKTSDNSAAAEAALMTVDPQGVVQFFKSISSDVFTASNIKGISPLNVSYMTAI